jgi:hypothetical protein
MGSFLYWVILFLAIIIISLKILREDERLYDQDLLIYIHRLKL